MIRTKEDLAAARQQLGWSVYELAAALRFTGDPKKAGDRVREMENGSREISGPVSVAVEAFLAGFTPKI